MSKTPRPRALPGQTIESSCSCGPVYVTLNDHKGRLFEVFARLGKTGGCGSATTEAVGVLISIGLRSGTDPLHVIRGLVGIRCHKTTSCIHAITTAIREHLDLKVQEEPDA